MLGIGTHAFISMVLFYDTITKPDDTMRMVGYIFFMCHQYDRVAAAMYGIENFHDLVGCFGIEITRGFISQYQ